MKKELHECWISSNSFICFLVFSSILRVRGILVFLSIIKPTKHDIYICVYVCVCVCVVLHNICMYIHLRRDIFFMYIYTYICMYVCICNMQICMINILHVVHIHAYIVYGYMKWDCEHVYRLLECPKWWNFKSSLDIHLFLNAGSI